MSEASTSIFDMNPSLTQ